MTQGDAIHLGAQAMIITLKLVGPILVASLGVGLVVSLFQSVTQIQEFTLTFVPKLAAVAVVLFFTGHWMLNQLVGYTDSLFNQIPHFIGG